LHFIFLCGKGTITTTRSTLSLELRKLWQAIETLEFKPTFVLISVTVIEVISNYYASRKFFRANVSHLFSGEALLPLYEYVYWFTADFVVQFIIPVLLILFVLRGRLREYGVGLGDARMGLRIAGLFLAIMIPLVWIVSGFESFQKMYPECSLVKESWRLFFIYEFFVLLYMIGWEFIWRGYVLFGLKERFGYYAVLIQTIPFVLLHYGKPQLEMFGAIIAGIALGVLALRTRSFWYCVLTHTSVMFSVDLISILRYKTQAQGIGVSSLIELIRRLL
jgi:membrane protease YdiL (CAAX protease family)